MNRSFTIAYDDIAPMDHRRIANKLKAQGIAIRKTDIYYVLKRTGLNRRLDRLFYVQEYPYNPVVTKKDISDR